MRPTLIASAGIPLFAVLLALPPLDLGCASGSDPSPSPAGADPAGIVVDASDCGGFPAGRRTLAATDSQDCLEYDYDGAGTLALRHVNAGLNCCPGTIAVEIAVAGGVITLDERGNASGCHCNCLFDIDLEIRDLPPGAYAVRVLEQLLEPGDAPLEFELILTGATEGSYCVERTHYPWGMGT